LARELLLGVRELFEVAGPFATDGFLAELVETAEVVGRKARALRALSGASGGGGGGPSLPTSSSWDASLSALGDPAFWRLPAGGAGVVTLGHLYRARTAATVGTGGAGGAGGAALGDCWSSGGGPAAAALAAGAAALALGLTADGESGGVDDSRSQPHAAQLLPSFLAHLDADPGLKAALARDEVSVAAYISSLPLARDPPHLGDLRQEHLVGRLAANMRASLGAGAVHGSRRLDASAALTAAWCLAAFRGQLDASLGSERQEVRRQGTAVAFGSAALQVAALQALLNEQGVTALCLDLIADGVQPELRREATRLLIALLTKDGGHGKVQEVIQAHFERSPTVFLP
jgi:hypothetical protein